MSSLITVGGTQIRIEGRLLRAAKVEAEGYLFLEDPASSIEQLKNCGQRIDLFTFVQRLPDSAPKYPYAIEPHNFAALPVSTFDEWWNKTLGFKGRNKAKQAEKKGVVVREVPFDDTLVKGIWEVYNESAVRQGEPNSHYGKSLEAVYKMEATFLDSSVFIGAFFEDNLIGFIKMVSDETRTQAGLMNIVSMVKHRDKAPTNALVVQAVRSCAERKIPYLVYASFAYGNKRKSTLSDFKERNGFQQIDVPRYYVPLTAAGRLALRLGLHRKFADRLPESVASRLRDLRAAWYKRKFQSVTEAV
jgi:hypothetical protein